MKTVYVFFLLLVALSIASPASAKRNFNFEGRKGHPSRHQFKHFYTVKKEAGFLDMGLRALCIPATTKILEDHEGRHECAYNHPNGFRAVGVGYNLDDNVELRRNELGTLFADYDKVYKGEDCLYNIQITALLALDAKRALDKAAEAVAPFDDFCCEVQAVFADIEHSVVGLKFPRKDLEGFMEKAALAEWSTAARELKETDWCYNNKQRCEDDIATVENGCNNLFIVGS